MLSDNKLTRDVLLNEDSIGAPPPHNMMLRDLSEHSDKQLTADWSKNNDLESL